MGEPAAAGRSDPEQELTDRVFANPKVDQFVERDAEIYGPLGRQTLDPEDFTQILRSL